MQENQITYYSSPIGFLKISATEDYITAINFIDEAPADFENNGSSVLLKCTLQLDEYFAGKRRTFDLILSQKGTSFQQKVWDLLYQIPYGKTISYLFLSKQYGDAKAIRAIASANGKNNLAIVIPCHRVIGSNQSLTGYAGGLWRKQWLLNHEAKYFAGVQQLFS